MENEKLVRMANQIASFFGTEPDAEIAVEGVASHLRRFWDPRMRRQLLAWVDQGGEGLQPLVLEAIRRNRERLASLTPRNAAPAGGP